MIIWSIWNGIAEIKEGRWQRGRRESDNLWLEEEGNEGNEEEEEEKEEEEEEEETEGNEEEEENWS